MENELILTIKPELLDTKIAIYQNTDLFFLKPIKHDRENLKKFKKITDQYQYRSKVIVDELDMAEIKVDQIRVVIARGGMVKPIKSGVYIVNEKLKHDLINSPVGEHSANLGGLIADDIAGILPHARAFIADPVVVDEMDDIARFSGLPGIKRKSIFHALNQKAVARKYAKSVMKKYEDLNLIIVHLGEGISIGAHQKGKVIDVNQAFDGEGPFSLERSGSLPMTDLVRMCFSGDYSQEQIFNIIRNEGGIYAYLGTSNAYEIEQKIEEGDKEAIMVLEAMAYQVSKYIGSMYPVLKGEVDAILLTGDIAHNKWFNNQIKERVTQIAPVYIYPGECIAEALAMNALMVLKGEMEVLEYK